MKLIRKPISAAATLAIMTIPQPMPRHPKAEFTGEFDRPTDQPAANDPPTWDVAAG